MHCARLAPVLGDPIMPPSSGCGQLLAHWVGQIHAQWPGRQGRARTSRILVLDGSDALGSSVGSDACRRVGCLAVRVLDRLVGDEGGQVRLEGFSRFHGKAGRQPIERRVGEHVGRIEGALTTPD